MNRSTPRISTASVVRVCQKRGMIPTQGEFDYIQKRVWKKYPNAEFVGMKRTCIARLKPTEPEEVWWELKWVDYKTQS